jgi:hypothetical protein
MEANKGNGEPMLDQHAKEVLALLVECSVCHAAKGDDCKARDGSKMCRPHLTRIQDVQTKDAQSAERLGSPRTTTARGYFNDPFSPEAVEVKA